MANKPDCAARRNWRVGHRIQRYAKPIVHLDGGKGRFLADASHELRSPLARLRVAAEFIADEKLRTRMTTDIAELDSLSAEILEKTRLESHLSPLVKTPLNVDELLGQLRDVTDDTRVVFELNAPQTIAGDAKSLGRAVGNLLNNATKFADKKVLLKSEMRDGACGLAFPMTAPAPPAPICRICLNLFIAPTCRVLVIPAALAWVLPLCKPPSPPTAARQRLKTTPTAD